MLHVEIEWSPHIKLISHTATNHCPPNSRLSETAMYTSGCTIRELPSNCTLREPPSSSLYWAHSDQYSDETSESEFSVNSEDDSFCSEVYFYFSQTREELKRKLEQERLMRQRQEEEAKMERERKVRSMGHWVSYCNIWVTTGSVAVIVRLDAVWYIGAGSRSLIMSVFEFFIFIILLTNWSTLTIVLVFLACFFIVMIMKKYKIINFTWFLIIGIII